jgi:hypothetical protein
LTCWFTRPVLVLLSLAGIVPAGCSITRAAASSAPDQGSEQISVVAHRTDLLFVSASGLSSQFPSGPLVPGDRVLGRDDIVQHGSNIGSDYEACTITFGGNVLCDDMMDIAHVGQLHVTWSFQWPTSGTTGPSAWSGVVDGGTGVYQNAVGDFQARALPNGDIRITADLTRP